MQKHLDLLGLYVALGRTDACDHCVCDALHHNPDAGWLIPHMKVGCLEMNVRANVRMYAQVHACKTG